MNSVLAFALGELVIVGGIIALLFDSSHRDKQSWMISFGSVILTGIGLIFVLAMAMYYFETPVGDVGSQGKEIFETCSTVFPPIVTLILGYFFGTKEE